MSIPKSSGAVLSSKIATPTVSGETCRRLDFCCLYRIIEECTALVTEPSQLVMVYEYHPSTPSGSERHRGGRGDIHYTNARLLRVTRLPQLK